mmetsp:Transcript_61657/g.74180  ORF Transcript_61657/g.74180 Transcript_61657/m.74180 type:complete len:221 (+) Transcript_61657:2571-3233(+)
MCVLLVSDTAASSRFFFVLRFAAVDTVFVINLENTLPPEADLLALNSLLTLRRVFFFPPPSFFLPTTLLPGEYIAKHLVFNFLLESSFLGQLIAKRTIKRPSSFRIANISIASLSSFRFSILLLLLFGLLGDIIISSISLTSCFIFVVGAFIAGDGDIFRSNGFLGDLKYDTTRDVIRLLLLPKLFLSGRAMQVCFNVCSISSWFCRSSSSINIWLINFL